MPRLLSGAAALAGEETISLENTFSTAKKLPAGPCAFYLKNTWAGTISVQCAHDNTNFHDFDARSTNGVWFFEVPHAGLHWRWGFKTGDRTSGDADGVFSW